MTFNSLLVQDLGLITLDACLGPSRSCSGFTLRLQPPPLCLRVRLAMLPDPLQVVQRLYPREPLKSLQRFHAWMHTKRRLSWALGVSSQLSFVVLVIGFRAILA
jgi:hypothetical protein